MIQEEMRLVAEKMGYRDFKASNGWLSNFKTRHNLRQFAVSGESADVQEETVEGWHERMKVLMAGYKAENVWNTDETECFYRALSDKTLVEKKECNGWKEGKGKAYRCIFTNAAGGKESPVVIGRASGPKCFKGLRDLKKPAGIPYYSSSKVWMTTDIMESILSDLNRRLVKEGRNILLSLDNVTFHDLAQKEKFSNIRIVFLPKKTPHPGCNR